MTYHFSAKVYESASEMLAEGKARRERLMSAPAPARRVTPRSWSYAPAPLPAKPALYRTAVETTMSYFAIGRRFNRDHATIVHGIKRYALAHGLPFPKRMGASA